MTTETLLSQHEAAIAEVLEAYPEKAKKSRAKHLGVDTPEGVKGACDATKRAHCTTLNSHFIEFSEHSKNEF